MALQIRRPKQSIEGQRRMPDTRPAGQDDIVYPSAVPFVLVHWPLAARAQQRGVPVIGFLHPGSAEPNANLLAAFRKGVLSEKSDSCVTMV
jgi:hypothetical protein